MRTTNRHLRRGDYPDSPLRPIIIDEMRHDLAEQEADTLQHSDIMELLLDGFEGLDNMPDIEIRDEWNALFGEQEINGGSK